MRTRIRELIRREADHARAGRPAHIVAKLNERPRALIAVVLGLVVVAVLVELGDRDAYEFVYFQF